MAWIKILTLLGFLCLLCFLAAGVIWLRINETNINTKLMIQGADTAGMDLIGNVPAEKWRHRGHEELNMTMKSTLTSFPELTKHSGKYTF